MPIMLQHLVIGVNLSYIVNFAKAKPSLDQRAILAWQLVANLQSNIDKAVNHKNLSNVVRMLPPLLLIVDLLKSEIVINSYDQRNTQK